jgi:hypothetical protein
MTKFYAETFANFGWMHLLKKLSFGVLVLHLYDFSIRLGKTKQKLDRL